MYYIGDFAFDGTYLEHHGILGMKWGVRRYQNKDGTLTTEGMERYRKFNKALDASKKEDKAYEKIYDNPAELKKMSDAYANNLSDDKRKSMFDRDYYKEHGNTFKDWYYDNFGQDSDDSPYKPEELRIASKEFIEAAKDFIGQKEWSQKALSTFQKEMSVASGLDDDYYLYDSQKRIAKKEVNKYLGFDYEKAKEAIQKSEEKKSLTKEFGEFARRYSDGRKTKDGDTRVPFAEVEKAAQKYTKGDYVKMIHALNEVSSFYKMVRDDYKGKDPSSFWYRDLKYQLKKEGIDMDPRYLLSIMKEENS